MAVEPPPDVIRVLTPLVERPAGAALVTDFDGTLAPIVSDPAAARPLDGAVDVLTRLGRRVPVGAGVCGRPVSFLLGRLAAAGGADGSADVGPIRLVGLYGLERATAGGQIVVEPDAQ